MSRITRHVVPKALSAQLSRDETQNTQAAVELGHKVTTSAVSHKHPTSDLSVLEAGITPMRTSPVGSRHLLDPQPPFISVEDVTTDRSL